MPVVGISSLIAKTKRLRTSVRCTDMKAGFSFKSFTQFHEAAARALVALAAIEGGYPGLFIVQITIDKNHAIECAIGSVCFIAIADRKITGSIGSIDTIIEFDAEGVRIKMFYPQDSKRIAPRRLIAYCQTINAQGPECLGDSVVDDCIESFDHFG